MSSTLEIDSIMSKRMTILLVFYRQFKLAVTKKARETAENFYKMGLSIEQIAQGIKYPVEVVKQWLGLARA